MGIGSTAKKIQILAERAEQLYEGLVELRERIIGLEESVEEASERTVGVEREQRRQRALLEAIAAEQGIDVESVLESVDTDDVEPVEIEAGARSASEASDGDDAMSDDPSDSSN